MPRPPWNISSPMLQAGLLIKVLHIRNPAVCHREAPYRVPRQTVLHEIISSVRARHVIGRAASDKISRINIPHSRGQRRPGFRRKRLKKRRPEHDRRALIACKIRRHRHKISIAAGGAFLYLPEHLLRVRFSLRRKLFIRIDHRKNLHHPRIGIADRVRLLHRQIRQPAQQNSCLSAVRARPGYKQDPISEDCKGTHIRV